MKRHGIHDMRCGVYTLRLGIRDDLQNETVPSLLTKIT